jgi:hypothetical protein
VKNTQDKQVKRRKGLFWVMVSEISDDGHLEHVGGAKRSPYGD